ncbi:unnamed protein product, partial [Meganyctiphanes norvegica]
MSYHLRLGSLHRVFFQFDTISCPRHRLSAHVCVHVYALSVCMHVNHCNYIKCMYVCVCALTSDSIKCIYLIPEMATSYFKSCIAPESGQFSNYDGKVSFFVQENMLQELNSGMENPIFKKVHGSSVWNRFMGLVHDSNNMTLKTYEFKGVVEEETKKESQKNANWNVVLQKPKKVICITQNFLTTPVLVNNNTVSKISSTAGFRIAEKCSEKIFKMLNEYLMNNLREENVTIITEIQTSKRTKGFVHGEGLFKKLNDQERVSQLQNPPKKGPKCIITFSVVLPTPGEIDIDIAVSDLKIETKRASGAGGQHVNTTDSAVRIVHLPTGVAVECQEGRSQLANKKEAMRKLRAQLYQKQLDEESAKYSTARKLQVGSRGRSEKIRTYNYPQDRVTDHRIGVSVHNLNGLLQGSDSLHSIIVDLIEEGKSERLKDIIYS